MHDFDCTKINKLHNELLAKVGSGARYRPDAPKEPSMLRRSPTTTIPKHEPILTETYSTVISLDEVVALVLTKAGLLELSEEVMNAFNRATIELERDCDGDSTLFVNWRTDVPNERYEADYQRWLSEKEQYRATMAKYETQLEAYLTKSVADHEAVTEFKEKMEFARLLQKYGDTK